MHNTALQCTARCYSAPQGATPRHPALHCTVMHSLPLLLHFTKLYCSVLHCKTLQLVMWWLSTLFKMYFIKYIVKTHTLNQFKQEPETLGMSLVSYSVWMESSMQKAYYNPFCMCYKFVNIFPLTNIVVLNITHDASPSTNCRPFFILNIYYWAF